MSNELATRHTAPAGLARPASVDLASWASDMADAATLANTLCKTDFVPASFRGKPEAAAAAILAGKSLGLDPMNALANIFVVQGRPALYARTMVALVLSAGHEVVRSAAAPESVTVLARRKGSADWQDFTWTIERARKAGYLSNKKYESDPIAMLTAKAQAEACRTIAPDVLTGVAAYALEEIELEDMGEKPKRSPAPGIQALAALAAKAEPAAQTDATPDPEAVPAQDWYGLADAANGDVATLQALHADAKNNGADHDTLTYIRSQAKEPNA